MNEKDIPVTGNQEGRTPRPIDPYSYHLGVMDCFCEMVGSGLKKLALSHTWDTREERDQYQEEVEALCEKYQVRAFAEDELLITPLFPEEVCRGKFLFLFYQDNEVMERYRRLKDMGESAAKSREAAMEFGRLLSYPETRLRGMLGDRA